MATRRSPSRLDKRREAEAIEAAEAAAPVEKTKKAPAAKKPTRRKTKTVERKRLVWGVFTGALKEEARFPYDQKAAAEERLEQLRSKGKKLYFLQAIKEVITDGAHPGRQVFVEDDEDAPARAARKAKRAKPREEEEEEEREVDLEMDDDDE